jgi:hypothetical protein
MTRTSSAGATRRPYLLRFVCDLYRGSRSKSGGGQGWQPLQTQTCNRPNPSPRKRDWIESRIVPRLRRAVRRRWIGPRWMLRHRHQGAEFFRASSPTSRYVVPVRDAAPTPAESARPSRAPKRPSVRTLKGKDQASEMPRTSSFSSDANAPLAARRSTKSRRTANAPSDDGAGASARVAPTAPSQVAGESGGLALSAKGRRRTIMARSVFGDELKPGERWKRRLLTSR